jgi:hypothetical protein
MDLRRTRSSAAPAGREEEAGKNEKRSENKTA